MKYILAFSLLFVATFAQAQAPAVPQASIVVSSLSQLTGYTGSLLQANWTDAERGGRFNLVDTAGLTVDNGIVFTSAKADKYWKRDLSQTNEVDIKWFNVVADSVTDNSANIQQANLAATTLHKKLIAHKGAKPYYLASAITLTTSLTSPDSAAFVGKVIVFQTGSTNVIIDGVTIIGQNAMTPAQALAAGLDTVTNFTTLAAYSRGSKTSVLVTDTLHGGLFTWLSSGTPNGTTRIAALGGGIWNAAVSDFAIRVKHNDITIQRCNIINSRIQAWRSDVLDSLKNIKIINNNFNVDFSYIEHSVNQNDAVNFRGVQNAVFNNNVFVGRNMHRVLKLQDNPLNTSTDTVSKYTTSKAQILGNNIYATTNSNKQVIDFFLEGLNVEIANNSIEGYGFSDCIENKTGVRCVYPVNTNIHDNQIKTDANIIFNIQGSLGANKKYWNGDDSISHEAGLQNIKINNNDVTYTGSDETKTGVAVQFYHLVSISGNIFHNPNNLGAWKAIQLFSNAVSDINNNIVDTGIIYASQITTNSAGNTFTPKFYSLNIGSNTIKNYWGGSGYGGIMITGNSSPTGIISVHDNNVRKDTTDAFQRNSIYFRGNNVMARTVTGNTTYAKNDLESVPLFSIDTVFKAINQANSWNYLSQPLEQNGNTLNTSINVGALDIHDVNLQISSGRKEVNVDTLGNVLINEFSGDEPLWPARKKLELRGASNANGVLDSSVIGIQLTNQSSLGSQVGITAANSDSRLKNYRYGGLYWKVTGSSGLGSVGDAIIGYKANLADTSLIGSTWFKSTGQVSIGDENPNAATIFNAYSPNKGILIPRMSRATFAGIASKPNGLFAFGTTLNKYIYYDSVNSLTKVLLDSAAAAALYQQKITLTTTGISGASTLIGNTLNIPQYSAGSSSTGAYDVVYAGTETWTGTTAPSSLIDHRYSWTQIGRQVTFEFQTKYTTAGTGLTTLALTWPSDLPLPLQMSSVSSTGDIFIGGNGRLQLTPGTTTGTPGNVVIKSVTSGVYQILILSLSAAYNSAYCTITYISAN